MGTHLIFVHIYLSTGISGSVQTLTITARDQYNTLSTLTSEVFFVRTSFQADTTTTTSNNMAAGTYNASYTVPISSTSGTFNIDVRMGTATGVSIGSYTATVRSNVTSSFATAQSKC